MVAATTISSKMTARARRVRIGEFAAIIMHLHVTDNVQEREERQMTMRKCRRIEAIVVFLVSAAAVPTPQAQAPSAASLADIQRLKCTFTLLATGTWDNGVPSAEVTKAALSMQFEAIDTQEGTANVADVSTLSAGAPHITVRLLGDSLHFL